MDMWQGEQGNFVKGEMVRLTKTRFEWGWSNIRYDKG